MQLTLSEALKDDVVALETGVFNLLPAKDLSGRTLLFVSGHKHTREGYTSESLVSYVMYLWFNTNVHKSILYTLSS